MGDSILPTSTRTCSLVVLDTILRWCGLKQQSLDVDGPIIKKGDGREVWWCAIMQREETCRVVPCMRLVPPVMLITCVLRLGNVIFCVMCYVCYTKYTQSLS